MCKLWEWDLAYSQVKIKCDHWIKRIKKRTWRKGYSNIKKLSTKIDWKIKRKGINNSTTTWAKNFDRKW
jgi:hypothetical protein